MTFRRRWWLLACAAALSACTPRFDWREVRTDEALTSWFPCRVEHHERPVVLAGTTRPMRMLSCTADDLLFAISRVDAGDEADRARVLEALQRGLAENIDGMSVPAPDFISSRIAGEVPVPRAAGVELRGRRADGRVVAAHGRWFCQGRQIYQATVLGPRLDAVASETFFGSLRLGR